MAGRRARLTGQQVAELLKSSNLVNLDTPLSQLVENSSRIASDPETDVNILLITNYAVVTPVEQAEA